MYKLIPQLIVFFSAFIVIVIILRRVPEVTIAEEDSTEPAAGRDSGAGRRRFLDSLIGGLKRLLGVLLHYARAAKEHSSRVNYLERFSKVLRLNNVRPRSGIRAAEAALREAETENGPEAFRDQTEKSLVERIQKNPSDRSAYEDLGKLYLERKKFTDAEEVYEYLTRNYDAEDGYFSRLGTVYFNLKKFDQAATAYSRAIELRGDLPNRHVNLSLCFEALGDYAKAVEAVRKAIRISSDNAAYLSLLADLLIRSGKEREASETLEKILELEPANESARERLMSLKF